MKVLLWIVAFLLAVGILVAWRLGRKEPAILRGRWSPRLVRMVAVVLALLGAGRKVEGQTQPGRDAAADGLKIGGAKPIVVTVQGKPAILEDAGEKAARSIEFPAELTESAARHWAFTAEGDNVWVVLHDAVRRVHSENTQEQNRGKMSMDGFFNGENPALATVLRSELDAANTFTLKDVSAAAKELAVRGDYHPLAVAYLWRKTGEAKDAGDVAALEKCFEQLEDMARADNALRLALADAPILMTGWMSKAGPREGQVSVPADFVAAAKRRFAEVDAGLWETEGVLSFQLPAKIPAVTLIRRGQEIKLRPESRVRLRRLDILVVGEAAEPVVVAHRTLGPLQIAPKSMLTAFNAPGILTDFSRKQIQDWTAAAFSGDGDALNLLEMALPPAVPTVRKELAEHANGEGAAALRMLLQQYDGE